jgi:hypothetical protein
MTVDWLQQFETHLEQLEKAAMDDVPLAQLAESCHQALSLLAEVRWLRISILHGESVEHLCQTTKDAIELPDSELQQVDGSRALAGQAATDSGTASQPSKQSDSQSTLLIPRSLGNDLTFVLQICVSRHVDSVAATMEAGTAIAAVVAERLSHQLISGYEDTLTAQQRLIEFTRRISETSNLTEFGRILVNDGAALTGTSRLTLLAGKSGCLSVVAATGVADIKPEAETVQTIQAIANSPACDRLRGQWVSVGDGLLDNNSLSETDATADTNHAESGSEPGLAALQQLDVCYVRCENLQDTAADGSTVVYLLFVEVFDADTLPGEDVVQQLVRSCAAPLARISTQSQGLLSRLFSSRRLLGLAVSLAAVAACVLIPTDFELEVTGQLLPQTRQRIFAPEDGVIEEVLFTNEQAVEAEQPLLTLSNPDMELELQRVRGELAAAKTRLETIRISQLTDARSTTGRDNESRLSAEEVLVQKQVESLTAQQQLIQQQLTSLAVTAPIAGRVIVNEPARELNLRPVRRGQVLCELISDTEDWRLQLEIPDRHIGYLNARRAQGHETFPVRYALNSAPEQEWQASINRIAAAVQIVDARLICLADGTPDQVPDIEIRPGSSLRARIYCGRRSIGFVLFRELIEFGQRIRFAWF